MPQSLAQAIRDALADRTNEPGMSATILATRPSVSHVVHLVADSQVSGGDTIPHIAGMQDVDIRREGGPRGELVRNSMSRAPTFLLAIPDEPVARSGQISSEQDATIRSRFRTGRKPLRRVHSARDPQRMRSPTSLRMLAGNADGAQLDAVSQLLVVRAAKPTCSDESIATLEPARFPSPRR